MDEEDKQFVARARKIQKFFSQPMFVAEVFTQRPGRYVKLKDTIEGFEALLEGKYDHLPEDSFYMAGNLADVESVAKKK